MIFKRGFFLILIRVLLIVLFSIGAVYSYLETDLSLTPYMFSGLILITTIELTWRLQSQERNWTQFLQSMKYGDYNRSYQKKTYSKELQEAYELISEGMESLKTSRQAEVKLLQTLLRHISVAVVCFRDNGEIIFTNKPFNLLLNIEGIISINALKQHYPDLLKSIMLEDGGTSTTWIDHPDGQKLLVKTEAFKLKGQAYRLTSITDIRSSLEVKELESYQKLMSVMTHEIMNSTTPILSLIQVVNRKLVDKEKLKALPEKDQRNLAKSLLAIEERTDGMLNFVQAYKQINKPIEPIYEYVTTNKLLDSLVTLMDEKDGIDVTIQDDYQKEIFVDLALITQVLINLLKNAKEAVIDIDSPKVKLEIQSHEREVLITVEDNGHGIEDRLVKEIFVPFFTTKKEGSGIGLALSRKIVIAHKGSLTFNQESGKTRFGISLPLH